MNICCTVSQIPLSLEFGTASGPTIFRGRACKMLPEGRTYCSDPRGVGGFPRTFSLVPGNILKLINVSSFDGLQTVLVQPWDRGWPPPSPISTAQASGVAFMVLLKWALFPSLPSFLSLSLFCELAVEAYVYN